MTQHALKALACLVLALPICYAESSQELCAAGSANVDNNWYCQQVDKITYTNIDQHGTYMRTTGMDLAKGTCMRESVPYSGPGAPFHEEVSIHLRGPLKLSQFAAYTLGSSTPLVRNRRNVPDRNGKHGHPHGYNRKIEPIVERAVGDMVTAVIDGQIVSWVNAYDGSPATPIAEAAPVDMLPTKQFQDVAEPVATEGPEPVSPSGGSWSRIAYYNSASAEATGLAFLNNRGDPNLSGTFDMSFGNSASYASEDGKTAAKVPTRFRGSLDTFEDEIFIMTDIACADNDCSFYRPGSVAHHGFDGPSKAFFFEFSMPHDASGKGKIPDAPAIWMLNAQIPRVSQFGHDKETGQSCSCWSSGCGEFDICEVLATGDERCKSTLHRQGSAEGGDSNYFIRPTANAIKLALFMHEGNFTISILRDDVQFEESWGTANVQDMLSAIDKVEKESIFGIGQ